MLVALGGIEPGMRYYLNCTDGESEALLLKAKMEAARSVGAGIGGLTS